MKKLTIYLEKDLLAWVRVEAANAGKSISRYIGERLVEDMRRYELAALDRFLSGPGWPGVSKDLPGREQLYDRGAVHSRRET